MRVKSLKNQIKVTSGRSGVVRVRYTARVLPRRVNQAFLINLGYMANIGAGLKTKTARSRFLFLVCILDRLVKNGLFF